MSLRIKIKDLDERIEKVSSEMNELLQVKINLMSLRREFMMEDTKKTLEECFTPELKRLLNDSVNEDKS